VLFDKIQWVKADILDISSLEIAFEQVTHVYHCAALISFDPKDEEQLRKTNIEGTANVVNCCIDFGVKKLCYVSSIAALGDNKVNNSITEETPWNPEILHSDYALTKFGAEMEVWRGFQEGLEVVIVNPGVIFGYGFQHQGSDVMVQMVKKGLLFYTKGAIGIVAVEDVTWCMLQLMKSNISGERFILVAENLSLKELFDYLAQLLNAKKPSIYASKWSTNLAWRFDWVIAKIFRRKRKLTRSTARASHSIAVYDSKKVISALQFTFQKKEAYLPNII